MWKLDQHVRTTHEPTVTSMVTKQQRGLSVQVIGDTADATKKWCDSLIRSNGDLTEEEIEHIRVMTGIVITPKT